ncbi:MAG: DoxX [Bryobacterales bacterium]|nr:DoxX [Bryobacterales bacterium]
MQKMCCQTLVSKAYSRLIRAGNLLQPTALLVVRLLWGWRLYLSGFDHLTHVANTYKNFVEWHVPFARLNVYVSGMTEMIGGLLLLLGVFTRGAALIVFFNFCVALWATSRSEFAGLVVGPERWDHLRSIVDDNAFPFWTLGLILFSFGPGKLSVDYLIQRLVLKNCIRENEADARPESKPPA